MIVGQSEFRTALLNPKSFRPEGLQDGVGRPAGRRFDVYRNNVAVSLTEALETAFPVIKRLLGETNFRTLAGVFLREHPPSSPLMMFYGEAMPDFLKWFPPTSKMGYLPDVARLELALRESYHAADSVGIDRSALEAMPTDALMAGGLRLAPSLRLVRSNWPIHAIWRFNTEPDSPKPTMESQDVVVLRFGLDPSPHLLPAGGGHFIAGLQSGQTFGQALEVTTAAEPNFDIAATLALLIGAEAIISIGA